MAMATATWIAASAVDDPRAASSGRQLVLNAKTIEIEARGADGAAKTSRTISMLAYTGGPMQVPMLFYPVVVDLQGMSVGNSERPILIDHQRDLEHTLGQTTSVKIDGANVLVAGKVFGESDTAKRVIALNDNGFKFQASIGLQVLDREFIAAGTKVTINGMRQDGPINVARKSVLGEISFVTLGADDSTSARIAATAAKGIPMSFAQWLEAKGFALADLSDSQKVSLQAMFDQETAAARTRDTSGNTGAGAASNGNGGTSGAGTGGGSSSGTNVAANATFDNVVARAEAEQTRRTKITELTASAFQENPHQLDLIKALGQQALDGGWDVQKYELELLRSSRSQSTAMRFTSSRDREITSDVIEAAVCLAGGIHEPEKHFKEQTLEAAQGRWKDGLGLAELLITFARRNGQDMMSSRNPAALLRAAFAPIHLAASAPSTLSLPGILSNVANKFLRMGFDSVESTWRQIAATRPVRDFKAITTYTMTGDFKYVKLPPGGKLEHASPGEMSYANQAETYGRMFAVDRRDIINDDLNAITGVPRRLGRGGALKFNDVFWTEFLAEHTTGKTLFPTDNSKLNYLAGATPGTNDSRMNIEGLTRAEAAFFTQTDPDGAPLAVVPKVLLVPPGLNATASVLMRSAEIRDNTAGTQTATANPHAGKFSVVMSAYLANAAMGGANSAAAWYLLADPNDLPFIEAVFLNGQESPTVESADADFNTLGIQFRGYHDFGVDTQEYRAAVKSKGSA
jgi:phage major head subunit gpT-like protein